MYSYVRTVKCLNCKRKTEQNKFSSTGKYCSNQCQKDYEYKQYIERWQAGKETGLKGKTNISNHVRRYIVEKYHGKCCECGWSKRHPDDDTVVCEVDHKDGNYLNNTEDNLRLLCPNCHALTSTYKNRNMGKSSRTYNAGVPKRPTGLVL